MLDAIIVLLLSLVIICFVIYLLSLKHIKNVDNYKTIKYFIKKYGENCTLRQVKEKEFD